MTRKTGKLGLLMLTTLVAGNMIGSGIFLLPSNLASIGSISLLSWLFTAVGAFFLAMVFSRMSILVPKTGGPYAYAQAGFGEYVGFQTAYNYWVAIWVGNAAIALAMVGYLAVFFPVLQQPLSSCLCAIAAVWLLTVVNIIGVRSAGMLQVITTVLKFFPLLLIALLGWFFFHPTYLTHSFNISGNSNFSSFSHAATLTMWTFIGVESATVPAAVVDNPRRNIPLATLLGTLIAATLYIVSSTALMGMLPASELAVSSSPFAAAAAMIFGKWGEWIIAAGATISCFGGLNGWVLLQGQVAMAAADDKLFPGIFSKRNSAGVPAWGIAITSFCITILLLLTISPNLVKQFQTIILIATLTSLIPYLYTAVANLVMMPASEPHKIRYVVIALCASLYAFWAILGSGEQIIFYGSILVFSSVPLYALVCWHKRRR